MYLQVVAVIVALLGYSIPKLSSTVVLVHPNVWVSAFEPISVALVCSLVGVGVKIPVNRYGIFANVMGAFGLAVLVHLLFYYWFRGAFNIIELVVCVFIGFGGAPLFYKVQKALLYLNFKEVLLKWLTK